jgi:hypothetical protein
LRETQEKSLDFFDQFNWQGLGHLGDLFIAYTLNPEEETIQDNEIFVWHDCFTLGDLGGVLAVPVSNLEVFSGAEQGGGGGVAVSHVSKLSHSPDIARKIFTFCRKKTFRELHFFLDGLIFYDKEAKNITH